MAYYKLTRSTVAFITVGLMVAIAFNPFIDTMAWRYPPNTNLANIDYYYRGENANHMLGWAVANAGDVNGDGRDDTVFGAYNFSDVHATSCGKIYILLGKESGKYGNKVHIAYEAEASYIGKTDVDNLGFSVDGAGDVNGDGFDDVIVGAPGGKGTLTGGAYLIFGRASSWSQNQSIDKANVTFTGENLGDAAGYSVAGLGDINGDGFDDVAIGAPGYDSPEILSGAVYIFMGHSGQWNTTINLTQANSTVHDLFTNEQLGSNIDTAGDVNGDNLDDILFGLPHADNKAMSQAGMAYIMNGKPNSWNQDYDISTAASTTFSGTLTDSLFGNCIAGGGDYNNDGYDDVLIGYKIGKVGAENYYHVALFGGGSNGPAGGNQSSANTTFYDTSISNAYDGLETCAWAGDADGDGSDDILLGDPTYRYMMNWHAGKAYLMSGAEVSEADGAIDVGTGSVSSFYDTNLDDFVGRGLGGGGDMDGDGYDDILIGAYKFDVGPGSNLGKVQLVFPDHNQGPGVISDYNVYLDKERTKVLSYAKPGQTLYIQINGSGASNTQKELAMIKVTTTKGYPNGIVVPLMETGTSTGKYVGQVMLKDRTREEDQWIKAIGNETIIFRPLNTTSNGQSTLSFFVRGNFSLRPTGPQATTLEDQNYVQHFWAEGCPPANVVWDMKTNATWLNWDATNQNVTGKPDNSQVGDFYLTINISNKYDQAVSLKYNLSVINVPPTITWNTKTTPAQHLEYISDANSTDDGQGKITYSLMTNATWLAINSSSGTLKGTPSAYDVGPYYANVSVDDGNGGKAFKNATLTVRDVPDAPTIDITFPQKVPEDKAFEISLNCTDPDKGDTATWSMRTNASSWLKIDNTKLYGIADDPQIGQYWVNLTVTDGAGLSDSENFTLTIINIEEPPKINSTPIDHATALLTYQYTVTALDPDRGDVMTYSLTKAPTGMGIDSRSGAISWVPTRDQGGAQSVTVKVSDGVLSDNQTFSITVVTPATIPPQVTLVQPLDKSVINITNPQLSWQAEDPDSPLIYFDVFLSKDKGAVSTRSTIARIGTGVTEFVISLSADLEKGSTYYWTVDPNDGANQGVCTSGIWSFTIQKDAIQSSKPTAVLKAPIDNSTIKSLPVQLSWSGNDPDLDNLTYDIYVSQQIDLVRDLSATARRSEKLNATNLMLDGISIGTTYYWTVIPDDGTSKGDCLSGVWSFKIATTTVTNNPPTISSKPVTVAYVSQSYEYYIKANDTDGDRLTYSLVIRPKDMVIGFDDGHLLWLPKTDDLGSHDVTVRVSDGHVYVDQKFKVDVQPLSQMNHPPTIISTARTSAKAGVNYEYKVAASDIDNNILEYRLDQGPKGLKMNNKTGEITWKPKLSQAGSQQLHIAVSDGKATVWQNYTIKVERNPMIVSDSDPGYYIFLIILALVIPIIIIAAILARRRSQSRARQEAKAKTTVETASAVPYAEAVPVQEPVAPVVLKDEGVEDFKITEIFLIYHDGRLITYSTTEETEGLDKQIISGMLVAIQSFVKESFQSQQGLDSFEFGDKKVILKGGKYVVLAAVLNGVEPHVLREEMQSIITRIETLYAGKVEKWDGNIETFADAPRHMSPLFHLRNRLKIKEKEKGVRMKSGVEFYSGYVRLKVGVSNELEGPISNINIDLAYDINTLRLSHIEPKYPISDNTVYLPDILPNEKRTVAVYFDPLICQESHIDGKVRFIDPAGNEGEAHMKRRPVDVVCPIFYTVETINVAMLKRLLGELSYSDSRIYEVKDPGALAGAHDMAVVSVRGHDVKLVREFTETEPYEVETWFYGEAKESEEKLVIKVSSRSNGSILEIFVASDNLASMTGLLAELGNEFRKKMDEKGIDRESLLLSTDEKMKDVLKETKLLLDKFADSEVEPEENEPRDP